MFLRVVKSKQTLYGKENENFSVNVTNNNEHQQLSFIAVTGHDGKNWIKVVKDYSLNIFTVPFFTGLTDFNRLSYQRTVSSLSLILQNFTWTAVWSIGWSTINNNHHSLLHFPLLAFHSKIGWFLLSLKGSLSCLPNSHKPGVWTLHQASYKRCSYSHCWGHMFHHSIYKMDHQVSCHSNTFHFSQVLLCYHWHYGLLLLDQSHHHPSLIGHLLDKNENS